MSAEKNATYVIGLHVSLLPSLSDCWIVCTCCDTADSIRSSSLLNSSKQPQAPTWHRPTKIRPMAWKKSVKKRESEDYNRTGCRKRPSPSTTTVLFRTTFTRTIILNLLMKRTIIVKIKFKLLWSKQLWRHEVKYCLLWANLKTFPMNLTGHFQSQETMSKNFK